MGSALRTIHVAGGSSAQVSQHKGLSFLVIRMKEKSCLVFGERSSVT